MCSWEALFRSALNRTLFGAAVDERGGVCIRANGNCQTFADQ